MENLTLIFVIINLIINGVFFTIFELKKPDVKDFIPITVICAAASLGRLVFSFIPQVQPVTALVIISGSAYGGLYGYITGSLCALISNMLLGQGTWTLFQMTGWGIVGLIAGIIGRYFSNKNGKGELITFSIYGALSAFIFSIITDFSTIAYLGDSLTPGSAITVFATGIAFNISHAIFNVILIVLLYHSIKRKLIRCRHHHL